MTTARPVALVTGASSGIGKAAALALLGAGFDVVGTSRDTSRVSPLDGVTFVDLDVAGDAAVTTAVEQVIDRFGRIDVLVNNAGGGLTGAAEENSVAQVQGVFDVNVFGVIRMTQAVLPHMRSRGSGRIINLSSIFGLVPAPYLAAYAASKHAVEGYSESVDHEVREHGVRVLLVEPGATSTKFDANSTRPDSPLQAYDKQRRIAEQVIAASVRDGDAPATVAQAIVAAATDADPKLRYTAGPLAGRISTLRRVVPPRMFYAQIRKYHQLPR
ncbi:oxidoreductase [Promicromonospora sp. NPDC057138]|uniref:oxidoreductase n=1 Tax=Promicromonospora sp. NPDC057138 TaxID=3346031 RepID=UPI003644B0A8